MEWLSCVLAQIFVLILLDFFPSFLSIISRKTTNREFLTSNDDDGKSPSPLWGKIQDIHEWCKCSPRQSIECTFFCWFIYASHFWHNILQILAHHSITIFHQNMCNTRTAACHPLESICNAKTWFAYQISLSVNRYCCELRNHCRRHRVCSSTAASKDNKNI